MLSVRSNRHIRKLAAFGTLAAVGGLSVVASSAKADDLQRTPTQVGGNFSPQATGAEAETRAVTHRVYRAETLMGAKIRNPQGQDLGNVKEFVVDPRNGAIRYAVVSYGGFLDVGDKLFAVPLPAMQVQHGADNEAFFVVNVDQQKFDRSRGFDDDHWPNFADASFTASVDQQYGVKVNPAASGASTVYKLSTFEGTQVRDNNNVVVGDVDWVLIDPAGAEVAYLVVDLEDSTIANPTTEDRDAVVPMRRFKLTSLGNDTFFQVDMPAESLRSAPTVTDDQFDRTNDFPAWRRDIDRFYGNTRDTVREGARETGAAVENAAERTGDALRRTGQGVGNALERTGEGIKRIVD